MVGCSRGWRISRASVCSAVTTSPTSATGAAGTPASVKSRCHSAVSRSCSRSESTATSCSRCSTRSIRVEPRIGQELEEVERAAERGEEPVVPAGDHQLAVARGEDLVRRDHREDRSLGHRHRPVGEEPDEVVTDVAERSLVERRVDFGPLAGSLALEECRDDPDADHVPRTHVDQRRADANARPSRLSGHADEAACRLHECVVPRLARERPALPLRRSSSRRAGRCERRARPRSNRAVPRVPVGGSAGRRRRPRRASRAPDGRARHRLRARATAFRVDREEHRSLAVPEGRPPGSSVVARVRSLDLDHIGPERGEDLRAERARDRGRDVEDARAGERKKASAESSPSARMRACPTGSTSTSLPSGSRASGVTSSSSRFRRSTRSFRSSRVNRSSSSEAASPGRVI